MTTAQHVATHEGVDIFLHADGLFRATPSGKRKQREADTLAGIKKVIDEAALANESKTPRPKANEPVTLLQREKLVSAVYIGTFAKTIGAASYGHHFRTVGHRVSFSYDVQVLREDVSEEERANFARLLSLLDETKAAIREITPRITRRASLPGIGRHSTPAQLRAAQTAAQKNLRAAKGV